MNFKIAFTWTLALTALLFLAACEKEEFAPTGEELLTTESLTLNDDLAKKPKKDKERGNNGNNDSDTDPDSGTDGAITYGETYQVVNLVNNPLYRFSFSTDGSLVLLESDSSVGNFGSDYFGFWTDPFAVTGNEATWVQGLSTITWTFEPVSATSIRVTETNVQQPYLSGETTTTVTDLGVYAQIP